MEKKRLDQGVKFAFEIWLYVEEFCKTEIYCGIFQRKNDTHKLTPNIFLGSTGIKNSSSKIFKKKSQQFYFITGEIAVEVIDSKQRIIGAKTLERLVKNDWCRLVFNFNADKWEVYINCMNNFIKQIRAEFVYKGYDIHYNDVDSIGIIGGTDRFPSFTGYISKFRVYRHINVITRNLVIPHNHDRFIYNKKDWNLMCDNHLLDINNYIKRSQNSKGSIFS